MKFTKRPDSDQWLIYLLSLVLLVFSAVFYKERIIYTDTAVYMYGLVDTGYFFVATNRFISALPQVLPLVGMLIGLPLKAIMLLYSIGFMLIPVLCALVCLHGFKDKATSLAILLFYTLSNFWLFYYPVSEFQTGLCLLLTYHAFVLHFFKKEKGNRWVFLLVTACFISTIIFSHPLSIVVFIAWMVWLFFLQKTSRNRLMLIPLSIAGATYWVRETFFYAMVGDFDYEQQRMEGLERFSQPVHTFFDNHLSTSMAETWVDHNFVTILLVVTLLGYFLHRKRWWHALLLGGSLIAFWLLVTVSFQEWRYGHYMEHLYQPLTFFIVLAAAPLIYEVIRRPALRMAGISLMVVVPLFKVYSNNEYNAQRLQWYANYIGAMHRKDIKKANLPPRYVVYGEGDSYWASFFESALLSAMPGPDSTVILTIDRNPDFEKLNAQETRLNTRFFNIPSGARFYPLDTLLSEDTLQRLRWEVK